MLCHIPSDQKCSTKEKAVGKENTEELFDLVRGIANT